jgi:hypothetical protein
MNEQTPSKRLRKTIDKLRPVTQRLKVNSVGSMTSRTYCTAIYYHNKLAGRVGRPCCFNDTNMPLQKYLCNKHFLETDFTAAERIHLNRVAVPYVSD